GGGRKAPETAPAPPPPAAPSVGLRPPLAKEQPTPAVSGNGTAVKREKDLIPAGPATRRLARELGVTLTEVSGTGRGGRVTLDDIKGFVRSERTRVRPGGAAPVGMTVANSFAHPPLPDFAKFGEVETRDLPAIRQ